MTRRQVRVSGKTKEKRRGIASCTNVARLHSRVRRTFSSCLLCFLMESGICIITPSLLLSFDSARSYESPPFRERAVSSSLLQCPTLFTSPLSLLSMFWGVVSVVTYSMVACGIYHTALVSHIGHRLAGSLVSACGLIFCLPSSPLLAFLLSDT
jgi:hypothetical protein